MFWIWMLAAIVVLLWMAWFAGRRHRVVTMDQLERQRRQLGIHDGNGNRRGDM